MVGTGYDLDVVFSARAVALGWKVVVDHTVRMRHTYHSSVRQVEGLLQAAAAGEDAYLRGHWGSGYREHLSRLQHDIREFA